MLELFDTPKKNMSQVILILDKVEKIGVDAVTLELERIGLLASTVQSIKQFLLVTVK